MLRDPFHRTLYTWHMLDEHKWIESLTRDAEGLQAAKRNAIAFNCPKDLEGERVALLDRMGSLPSTDEAMKRGLEMIASLNRKRETPENGSDAP